MSNTTLPAVAIAGIGQSRVYLTKTGEQVFPPNVNVKRIVKKIAPAFLASVIFRCDAGLSNKVLNAIKDELENLSLDADGHEKYDLTVERFTESFKDSTEDEKKFIKRMLPADKIASEIGEENFYFYTYNSFGDTEKIVDELNCFIDNVLKQKGTDKVNLVPVSLGGTVATAYLTKYGSLKKVNRVVGVVPAFDGSSLVTKILDGDFSECADEVLPREIKKITNLLTKKTKGKLAQSIINAFREKILLNSNMAWGAIPHDDFLREAQKYNLSGKLKDTCMKYFEARSDFNSFVKKQQENGTEIFSLCGCCLLMEKMLRIDDRHSDGIVDTASSSMGALCDDVNLKIDVTKSAISDRVWFFEKMGHEASAKNEKLLALTSLLLKNDEINHVNDNINFPQFN